VARAEFLGKKDEASKGGEGMRNKWCVLALVLVAAFAFSRAAAWGQGSETEQELERLREEVTTLRERIDAIEIDPQSEPDPNDFRVFWKDGVRMETADKSIQWRIGGRIMIDTAWFDQDSDLKAVDDWEDANEVRRARIYMSGTMYENVEFKLQYDWVGGDPDLKDMYVGLKGLPFGGIRVGHLKEPFGLQQLTSSKNITFMERALPGAMETARNAGIMVHNHVLEDRMTWAVGAFRDTDDFGSGEGDNYNVTGRVTGLPVYENEGEKLVHLGLDYSYRHFDDEVRLRQRPESHLAGYLVNTDHFEADNANAVAVEGALVCGPASVQAEYTTAMVDSRMGGDPDFDGYYIEASYFLTGEHRRYKTSSGVFDRIKPKRNFLGKDKGPGAWQIAARYSHLDLEDADINGGELDTVTAGLNWYLNPNTRVMLNYVFADADDRYDGEANILQTRFQVEF
jgi:phosphate-selective porin OprO/OprP